VEAKRLIVSEVPVFHYGTGLDVLYNSQKLIYFNLLDLGAFVMTLLAALKV
jgi:hypothetical protein